MAHKPMLVAPHVDPLNGGASGWSGILAPANRRPQWGPRDRAERLRRLAREAYGFGGEHGPSRAIDPLVREAAAQRKALVTRSERDDAKLALRARLEGRTDEYRSASDMASQLLGEPTYAERQARAARRGMRDRTQRSAPKAKATGFAKATDAEIERADAERIAAKRYGGWTQ